jgi:hypothetical protein
MNSIPKPPIVLTDKASELNDKFFLILNEIVKTYPSAKGQGSNPSNSNRNITNDAAYAANMKKLVNLQNEYFMYKNDVIMATEAVNKIIQKTDKKINSLEMQNKVLNKQYDNLKASSYSADGLFDDAQITRNELLISNFILFGVMCGGGFLYYKSMAK